MTRLVAGWVMVWKRDHAPRLDVFPVPEPSAEQP